MEKRTDDGKHIISGTRKDETIYVDNTHFKDCILQRCRLIFGGGEFSVEGIKLIDCSVEFTNEAAHTITFIKLFCDKSGMTDLNSLEKATSGEPKPEIEGEQDIKDMIPISLLEQ